VVDLTSRPEPEIIRVLPPGSHEERHITFSAEGLKRLRKGLEKAGLDSRFFVWPPENAKEEAARAATEGYPREREDEEARRLSDAQALVEANRTTARRTRIGLFAGLVLAAAAGVFGFDAMWRNKFLDQQRDHAEKSLASATDTATALGLALQKWRAIPYER
jgi:hypothetical protein